MAKGGEFAGRAGVGMAVEKNARYLNPSAMLIHGQETASKVASGKSDQSKFPPSSFPMI
jgi:hypothetical protein